MHYDLKMFNTGQVTIPKRWRSQFRTKRFVSTEENGWLLIKPVEEGVYDEKEVVSNLARTLEEEEGKLIKVRLSNDPGDPSVLYETEAGRGVYFPDGISVGDILKRLSPFIRS